MQFAFPDVTTKAESVNQVFPEFVLSGKTLPLKGALPAEPVPNPHLLVHSNPNAECVGGGGSDGRYSCGPPDPR